MERRTWCTGVVTVAIGVAGCGGSGPLSRKDFVKRGNDICKREIASIRAAGSGAKTFAELVKRGTPIMASAVRQLGTLRPPAELKTKYARLLTIERARLQQAREAVARGSARPIPTSVLHEEAHLGQELGLTRCAGGG